MPGPSPIEWTDATWNPIVGCSIVSPGCTNCYAMKTAGARTSHTDKYRGLTEGSKKGKVWTGEVRFWEPALLQPLKWRKPRRIFVNSMGDLFHESIPDEWIDRVFAVMAACPQHQFQVLTKRPERMRDYCLSLGRHHEVDRVSLAMKRMRAELGYGVNGAFYTLGGIGWHFKNIWLGTSCERQQEADERIPLLLATPAAVRFVSLEPLLGPIDLQRYVDGTSLHCPGGHVERFRVADEISYLQEPGTHEVTALCPACGKPAKGGIEARLSWVIVGGESGPNARPMNPQWARDIRDQCVAAGVAYFHKQNGEFASVSEVEGPGAHYTFPDHRTVRRVGKRAAGRRLDGVEWNEFPAPNAGIPPPRSGGGGPPQAVEGAQP